MYDQQNLAATADARKTILAQMQNLIYDQAVYDILYYDANLAAYRTDHFGGWQNQPLANGTPLFTYGTLQYTLLTDATAVPSPTPAASAAPSTAPGASPAAASSPVVSPAPAPASGSDNTALYVVIVIAVLVVAGGGLLLARRRRGAAPGDED
jgi:LPXTG-motif cell wall-anchored protein